MTVLPSSLRPFPSLSTLSDTDLAALSKVLTLATFRAGSQICREGDLGDSCFFLIDGEVEVTKQLGDGRRVFLAELSAGTIFGQGGLVSDRQRSADVRARNDVRVLSLRQLDHQWGLNQSAPWAVLLQRLICVHVVRQLRSALDRLLGLATEEQERGLNASAMVPPPMMTQHAPDGTLVANGDKGAESLGAISLSAPPIEAHDASTTGRLLTLLAETEASLADEGVNLKDVGFVVDADAARRTHHKKN